MKKVSLEELLEKRERDSYESQYRYVMELIDTGKIKPVKSSAGNGRKPALHTQYWLVEETVLNVYSTAEPFAYFAAHRDVPQKILILENKDPFFGMRRYLLERNKRILGEKIGTLIYGAGKRVVSSFREFAISAEPYMKESGNELLYFGDLDYEGIVIYETLVQTFAPSGMIRPFVPAYLAMLNKGDSVKSLPLSKEHQNKNITGIFFTFFDEQTAGRMKKILESGRYIPQEILNTDDYRGVPCNTNS